MRTTNEQVNEVFRRASLLRARRLRRKKILLGVCCVALSFHLMLLLKGRIVTTVAANTASYGSLVFEGAGNHYVMIAVVFFLLGIPVGVGFDALIRLTGMPRNGLARRKPPGPGADIKSRLRRLALLRGTRLFTERPALLCFAAPGVYCFFAEKTV